MVNKKFHGVPLTQCESKLIAFRTVGKYNKYKNNAFESL